MELLKRSLFAGVLGMSALFWGCSSGVSTDPRDYDIEEIDRFAGKWYPSQGEKVDSFFRASNLVRSSKLYYYRSKEEELDAPGETIYNHVRGCVVYGNFDTEESATAFFQALVLLDAGVDYIIRFGKHVYTLDDDEDLREVVLAFKEKVLCSFEMDGYEEYMDHLLR
jgi:hypothetical protein